GPFQGMPLTVLRACIAERVPYVDVADDRDFVRRAYALVETHAPPHGMLALIGCSVVPGLTSLLTRFAQATVHRIVQTKICISPGKQHPRGPGSFACLLSAVGKEFRDRKSTRLNSSHGSISYAVFCLKKKKNKKATIHLSITS